MAATARRGGPRLGRAAFVAAFAFAALTIAPQAARAFAKQDEPVSAATAALMRAKNIAPDAPILARAYKKEAEIEIWKRARDGRYVFLKSFPICRWSGRLGPKQQTGDRQVPEGFYSIGRAQMNPNSAYYLSFNVGYPNAIDRARHATGDSIMVHGTCSSMGCFAMTDRGVAEIYALARDALAGGQRAFQFQSYPFHLTPENMVKYRADPNIDFWRELKQGSDRFEATADEPIVALAGGHYSFASASPDGDALAQARRSFEDARVVALTQEGRAAVRTTYSDGGQNAAFAAIARMGGYLGEVSRPEALAYAGLEVVVTPARPLKQRPASAVVSSAAPPVWPIAPSLASAAQAVAPLADLPSALAAEPIGGWREASPEAPMRGALAVVPAHFSAMTPVALIPL